MRDLKYRGWDTDMEVMFFPTYIPNDGIPMTISSVLVNGVETCPPNEGVHVDYVLMQYTGLHDKAGTPVFEGDILKISNALNVTYSEKITQVCWNPRTLRYNGIPLTHECEVIGNVYEHSHLLKGEQNEQ